MATTSRSALARNGASGGAVGSSQSPNWNPPAQTPSCRPGCRSGPPTRACWGAGGPGRLRRRTGLVGPQGTTVAASPHAAAAGAVVQDVRDHERHRSRRRSGRRRGRPARTPGNPCCRRGSWAVGENTWMSPVQPSRSSRCGQSVGTSRKLPRIPQTTFSWNRLSSSCEDSNQPVRRRSRADDDGVDVGRLQVVDTVDLGVPEAVEREPRLEHLVAGASEQVGVRRLRGA